jgi:replication initiation and membrane attachment protein DnaB
MEELELELRKLIIWLLGSERDNQGSPFDIEHFKKLLKKNGSNISFEQLCKELIYIHFSLELTKNN